MRYFHSAVLTTTAAGQPASITDWPGQRIDPGLPAPTGSGVIRYISPSGSSSGDGLSQAARISLGRASTIAQPGDVIVLGDGDYGSYWSGGDTGRPLTSHNNGYYGRVAGTAANPITFVGENPPTYNRNSHPTGAVFTGDRTNNDNLPLYLGNQEHVRWWRFSCRRGQVNLALGYMTNREPMGPMVDCEFRAFHCYEANQDGFNYKHESRRVLLEDYLIEHTNFTLVENGEVAAGRSQDAINGNWPATYSDGSAWIPEAGFGRSFSGLPFRGEGHYLGYNSLADRTTNWGHNAWPANSNPEDLTCRRGHYRWINGGELFDVKPFMSGTITVEDFIFEDSFCSVDGSFNATSSTATIAARNGIVSNLDRHWTCSYTPRLLRARDGGTIEFENVICLDSPSYTMLASSLSSGNSITVRHATTLNWGGPKVDSTGSGTYAGDPSRVTCIDCADMGGGSGLVAGWITANGALDSAGPDYDNSTGKLGYGLRPNPVDNWATGAAPNPPTDLEGSSRPASSAAGALEPI